MAFVQENYSPPPMPPKLIAGRSFQDLRDGVREYMTAMLNYHALMFSQIIEGVNTTSQGQGPDLQAADTIHMSAWLHKIAGPGTIRTIVPPKNFVGFLTICTPKPGEGVGFNLATGGNISIDKTIAVKEGAVLFYHPSMAQWHVVPTIQDIGSIPGPAGSEHSLVVSEGSSAPLSTIAPTAAYHLLRAAGLTADPTWTTATYPDDVAIGDLLYASAAHVLSRLADVAAGSYLRSGGVGASPLWSTLVLPNAATQGDLMVATAANTVGSLADVAANQVLTSGGVGAVPAYSTTPTVTDLTATRKVQWKQPVGTANVVTYSASMTPNLANGDIVKITPTDGNAFTINAPTNPISGQRWLLMLTNGNVGAMGGITWDGVFKQLGTITAPAASKTRFFEMMYDGSNHWMMWESGSDVG